MATPRVSIVVPVLNEGENIPFLLPRISAAMAGESWELLIVDDDSADDTAKVCAALAGSYPLRLLVRTHPRNGLSGAVLHGFEHATGELLVVMDADLQHPPERLPDLVTAVRDGADFALGSRYAGGTTHGGWSAGRRLNSWIAVLLARPFAKGVSDPMSGFFALKRKTYATARHVSPMGYKIALELMHKCDVRTIREVQIDFGLRQHGTSKLTFKQQFDYLQHLSRLYDFTFPRAAPIAKFMIVLVLGLVAAAGAFAALKAVLPPLAALTCAYLLHIAITATFHARYIRAQREFIRTRRPWLEFALISGAELLGVLVIATWLLARIGALPSYELLAVSFLIGTIIRYVLRKELLHDVRGLGRDGRAI